MGDMADEHADRLFDPHDDEWRNDGSDELVTVAYSSRGPETEMAQGFKLASGFFGELVWIPKSLLVETRRDIECRAFQVPRWFAEQGDLDWT